MNKNKFLFTITNYLCNLHKKLRNNNQNYDEDGYNIDGGDTS